MRPKDRKVSLVPLILHLSRVVYQVLSQFTVEHYNFMTSSLMKQGVASHSHPEHRHKKLDLFDNGIQ